MFYSALSVSARSGMVVRCGSCSSSSSSSSVSRNKVLPARAPKGRRIFLVKSKPQQRFREFTRVGFSLFDSGVVGWRSTTRESEEMFSLKNAEDSDDDEYAMDDPLSSSFLGAFPSEWQNSNEKMRLVLDAFEGCSRTAMLTLGPIQACVSAQALLVFVAEKKETKQIGELFERFLARESGVGHGTREGEDVRGPRVIGEAL